MRRPTMVSDLSDHAATHDVAAHDASFFAHCPLSSHDPRMGLWTRPEWGKVWVLGGDEGALL